MKSPPRSRSRLLEAESKLVLEQFAIVTGICMLGVSALEDVTVNAKFEAEYPMHPYIVLHLITLANVFLSSQIITGALRS